MKATSGGTFDRDSSPVYFIASTPSMLRRVQHPYVLVAVNELQRQSDLDGFVAMLDSGRSVLLDSGIYNLAMTHARRHGMSMDTALTMHPSEVDGFDALRDRYYDLATTFHDRLWGVIELDQGGAAVKPETRAMIERDTGLTPIPVYHPLLDGWDYYDTLAREYDRLCFGNLVKAPPPLRVRLMHTASTRAKNYPHLWTHLLGVHPSERWAACGLRGSLDSSSWLTGVRWMPSWKGWAALKMVGHYPPDMWYGDEGDGKGVAMLGVSATFAQLTARAMAADTHPGLAS